MALVWKYGEKPGLESWKGLTWGMVGLYISSFCFNWNYVMIHVGFYMVFLWKVSEFFLGFMVVPLILISLCSRN